jgi:hypothetical protein
MRALHTDDIYRERFQQYVLADGRVRDSRQINWRLVEWEQLAAVVTQIRGKRYLTHCKHPDFKFFVVYRWAGQEHVNGKPRPIRQWAVGWSNGAHCFMTDIDFKTGETVGRYVVPVAAVSEHIHPRIGGRCHAASSHL